MVNKKEKTPKEMAEFKSKRREVALKNLNESNLSNLATAYFVNESGQFGEQGDSAVEQYKYFPSLNAGFQASSLDEGNLGEEYNPVAQSLMGSRADGKRYSGNVSEHSILKNSAINIQQSLSYVKVGDVLELLGSEIKVKDELKDVYVEDLKNKNKELFNAIAVGYTNHLNNVGVSESLIQRDQDFTKGLETLVTEPEKTD